MPLFPRLRRYAPAGLPHRPLLVAFAALLLATCVSAPPELRTLSADPDGRVEVHNEPCRGETARPLAAAAALPVDRALRLTVWNMHKEDHPAWRRDFARVSAGSDLLLLQEARLTPGLRAQLATDDYAWTLTAAFRVGGEDNGVLTAARAPAADWCSLRATEPWLRVPKSALVTHYALAGRAETLAVANLHGINFALGGTALRRQLDALAALLERHDGPLIVAGDFNTWSEERQQVVAALAARLALTPVTLARDTRSRFLGRPVDHIYTRGLLAGPARVLWVTSSDHHALTVTLRLPPHPLLAATFYD